MFAKSKFSSVGSFPMASFQRGNTNARLTAFRPFRRSVHVSTSLFTFGSIPIWFITGSIRPLGDELPSGSCVFDLWKGLI